MTYNTRFNPTTNGPLHLGHLYLILINQEEAHRSGGKFTLRYDDTQLSWIQRQGHQLIKQYKQDMLDDLDYVGIIPDVIDSQAEMMPRVNDYMHNIFDYHPAPEQYNPGPGASLAGCNHHYYPYTDQFTAEKVIMDMMEEITYLIRGADLITEDCLYSHFCAQFNLWRPLSVYVPRLNCGKEISKTGGNCKISDFRQAGYDPQRLISNLADDCLTAPGWFVHNIKVDPALSSWTEDVLCRS